jgi:hypothetical protein
VLIFFDGILIFSNTWSSHLQHVWAVLLHLHENDLAVKCIKCSFGATTVAYLGHIISEYGVAMDTDKVEAIRSWLPPHMVHIVRGFLGLTGDIAAPLTQLLKREAFCWSPSMAATFKALKGTLNSAPVLQLLDFSKPFVVDCDTSGSRFGAVLHQGDGQLAFYSRTIAPHHAKLTAYERALIDLVKVVKHQRLYL